MTAWNELCCEGGFSLSLVPACRYVHKHSNLRSSNLSVVQFRNWVIPLCLAVWLMQPLPGSCNNEASWRQWIFPHYSFRCCYPMLVLVYNGPTILVACISKLTEFCLDPKLGSSLSWVQVQQRLQATRMASGSALLLCTIITHIYAAGPTGPMGGQVSIWEITWNLGIKTVTILIQISSCET